MPRVWNWQFRKVQLRTGTAPMARWPLIGRNRMLRRSPPVGPKLTPSKWVPSSTSITAGPSMKQSVKVRPSRIAPPPFWILAR